MGLKMTEAPQPLPADGDLGDTCLPEETATLEHRKLERIVKGMETNRFGHYFTYHRGEFWAQVNSIPSDVRIAFVNFGLAHPIRRPTAAIDYQRYELHYLD